MMKTIYDEIHFLSYTVDISKPNIREYKETPEKGLNILKNIRNHKHKLSYDQMLG